MKNKPASVTVWTGIAESLTVLAVLSAVFVAMVSRMTMAYPFFTFHSLLQVGIVLLGWFPLVAGAWFAVSRMGKQTGGNCFWMWIPIAFTATCLCLMLGTHLANQAAGSGWSLPTPPKWAITANMNRLYEGVSDEEKQTEEIRLPAVESQEEQRKLCVDYFSKAALNYEDLSMGQTALAEGKEYAILSVQCERMARDIENGKVDPATAYAVETKRQTEVREAGRRNPLEWWDMFQYWEDTVIPACLRVTVVSLITAVLSWLVWGGFVLARRRKTIG